MEEIIDESEMGMPVPRFTGGGDIFFVLLMFVRSSLLLVRVVFSAGRHLLIIITLRYLEI